MTNLLARILLSIMLLPLAVVVYLTAFFLLRRGFSNEQIFLAATLVTAAFVVFYWLILWRRTVRWTSSRVQLTLASSVGCVTAGVAAAFAIMALYGRPDGALGVFMGGLVGMVLWPVATTVVWRETAEERADRVRQSAGDALFCPKCGYNMTGLHMARCPECGTQYTLNQLFAAQRREHEIADVAGSLEERTDSQPRQV